MATAAKLAGPEREKLFAQLEVPFDPAQVKWRVMRTSDDRRSGAILPFADPRAYTDRLNQLFTPAGWTREYTISTVPSLTRVDRGKVIVTSKVLVATAVTITRLGSHTGTGEEWADRGKRRDRGGRAGLQARLQLLRPWAVSLSLRRDLGAFESARRTGCDSGIANVGAATGSHDGSSKRPGRRCAWPCRSQVYCRDRKLSQHAGRAHLRGNPAAGRPQPQRTIDPECRAAEECRGVDAGNDTRL
jgi:hypothetical protein